MKFKVILCVALCVVPMFLFAATQNFTRTLYLGMRGEDVRAMQKVLNADPDTRIASSGVGSLGNESDYFGSATKRALIRFQEKYRAEILTPSGLVSGTGVFGAKTRAKAAELLNVASVPKSETTTQVPAPSTASINPTIIPTNIPAINFLSTYSGEAGFVVEITGENFASKNSIYFGDTEIKDVMSKNGTSVRVPVPALTPGVYSVYIAHEKGRNTEDRIFAITKKGAVAPKVESITPDHVVRESNIVLRGFGFVKNNVVRSGAGDFSAELQNDGSLSVHIPEKIMPFVPAINKKKMSVPVWLYVVNENGVSNAIKFTLEL